MAYLGKNFIPLTYSARIRWNEQSNNFFTCEESSPYADLELTGTTIIISLQAVVWYPFCLGT